MSAPAKLVFVYDAPDGIGAAMLDAVHKMVSPATYPCSLCQVTYGALTMKRQWRDWLKTLPRAPEFLHRDGFKLRYPALNIALPAVLADDREGPPRVMLDARALAALDSVDALIAALERALGLEPRPAAG